MKTKAVQIKICGLTRPEDCLAVNLAKVDYAGFVFAPSRRRLAISDATALVQRLDGAVSPVGVFVDEDDNFILQAVRLAGLEVVQLHGHAQYDRISHLRGILPMGTAIWQRLDNIRRTVATFCSLAGANVAALPDRWLLDSSRPNQHGGTGTAFTWQVFQSFCREYPVVLAGGLDANNVAAAIALLHPAIVDCSSGVETDNQKDTTKIIQFCRSVRDVPSMADLYGRTGNGG
jgi:phosphoribosylanthranilate isomerase